jgi:hypothetical protein
MIVLSNVHFTEHVYCRPWVSSGLWGQGQHCGGKTFTEFSTLKRLEFPCTVLTAGLSTHDLNLDGASYITVTKMMVIHINTAPQKPDLIPDSLSSTLQVL